MTNSISEGLILLKVYKEMLFEMLQVLLTDLCDILLDVWEWIGHILLPPGSRIKEDIYYGLLLNQHFVCFIEDSVRDFGRLCIVHTIWWWLPVVLNGHPVWISNKGTAGIGGLHTVSEQSCHV